MSSSIIEKIAAKAAALPDEQQQAALEYIESLERETGKRVAPQDKSLMVIAATALALGLPFVTRDTEIRQLTNVTTVW